MKIAMLISGGVDSSVALRLLKDQGHDVTAFYLKIWLEDELQELGGSCPWEDDLTYIRAICSEIDVPLEIIPLQKEYFDTVVNYTIDQVKNGYTPNPDVMCNTYVKFGKFFDKIDDSYEKIATGHYANTIEIDGVTYLKQAPDDIKDQTYFLCNLKQHQLKRLMFPIGTYSKPEVRELAEKYNLPNKKRKDSQGICFLGKLKYNEFVNHYLGDKEGDMVEYETGKVLAKHNGYYYYTIGQRKGIGMSGGPWYVVEKDIEKNIVYVSNSYDDESKKRNTLEVRDFNWFADEKPKKNELKVKLRHGPHKYNCTIEYKTDSMANLLLDGNDHGIAKGQFAAFYDDDICLGAAVIN